MLLHRCAQDVSENIVCRLKRSKCPTALVGNVALYPIARIDLDLPDGVTLSVKEQILCTEGVGASRTTFPRRGTRGKEGLGAT